MWVCGVWIGGGCGVVSVCRYCLWCVVCCACVWCLLCTWVWAVCGYVVCSVVCVMSVCGVVLVVSGACVGTVGGVCSVKTFMTLHCTTSNAYIFMVVQSLYYVCTYSTVIEQP